MGVSVLLIVNLDSTVSNLRSVSRKNYILLQVKCNLFKESLSFSGVAVWNSIPVSIKSSPSLKSFVKDKGKRKVQGVLQSQTAALPRHQEEEETDKTKQAQVEQTYEKHQD